MYDVSVRLAKFKYVCAILCACLCKCVYVCMCVCVYVCKCVVCVLHPRECVHARIEMYIRMHACPRDYMHVHVPDCEFLFGAR